MSYFVYFFCALTSFVCCALLVRQYRRSPGPLISHSAFAFLCFAVANVMLFVDRIVLGPEVDLEVWRSLITLLGVGTLLAALILHQGKTDR